MWRDLGIEHVALILPKIDEVGWGKAREMGERCRLAGVHHLRSTYRPLDADRSVGSWGEDQARTVETVDFASSVNAATVYVCTGAATNLTWDAAVDALSELVAPAVARAAELGVPLLLEPPTPCARTSASSSGSADAMDVARAAGPR